PETLGREHQLAHDEQRPAVADLVERMRPQTAFVIAQARGVAMSCHVFHTNGCFFILQESSLSGGAVVQPMRRRKMTYYTGCIAAVPTANRQKYLDHVNAAWPLMRKHGATRMVESWGVDVPKGKVNDLYGAVNAKDDEAVVFSWIEWPDKAASDAAWQTMNDDPAMKEMPQMPFDGSRMIFGGFEPVFAEGSDKGAGYLQGFALAVPEKNRTAYARMAREAWDGAFRPNGCLGIVEGWGVDVPHGKQTDFYRAA